MTRRPFRKGWPATSGFPEGTGWTGYIWHMRYRMYQVYTLD